LLKTARLYYILQNCLFVHGGFIPEEPLEQQDQDVFLWDRSLVKRALENKHHSRDKKLTSFDAVFVGHTPTINFDETTPIQACDVCLMDTGAGWPGGVLTIMDIDTRQYCCSDMVNELYNQAGSYGRGMW
jgi:serine/threonine protein phosphatase 1